MNIHDYCTEGSKNLIKEYLSSLPKPLCLEGYAIRHKLLQDGVEALPYLNTRHIKRKLWEIKFSTERIFYIVKDNDNIYFLHACKKQKGKAEKFELNTALERAKQTNLL